MTKMECVQVAKIMRDIKIEIVTLLHQLHVINVAWLCNLDELAMRWDQSIVQSIPHHAECECIVAEMFMMNKMGTPVVGGEFQLNNCAFRCGFILKCLSMCRYHWLIWVTQPPLTVKVALLTLWYSTIVVLIPMIFAVNAEILSVNLCRI